MDDSPMMLITWIKSTSDVQNVKRSLKDLMRQTEGLLPPGTAYSCCEKFDSYLKGGLYPLVHFSNDKKLINMHLRSDNFIDTDFNSNAVAEQGVYEEYASINIPNTNSYNKVLTAVTGFRSMEEQPRNILLKEWKGWSGARGFMLDILEAGLSSHSVKFYVKKRPRTESNSFFYVVIAEVGVNSDQEEGLLVDLLQKFRVERWLGFRSLYKPFKITQ